MKTYRIKIFSIAKLEEYNEYVKKWISSTDPIATQQILFQDTILDLGKESVIDVMLESVHHLYEAMERRFIPIMKKELRRKEVNETM